jgi:hypothetical protein
MNYYLVAYEEDRNLKFPSHYSKVVEADNPKAAVEGINSQYTITSVKMIVNDQTGYTQLKNHLHNTLELTKPDIRQMVQEAIEDIVERRLDVFLDHPAAIQRIIDQAIREKSSSQLFWGDKKNLDAIIQDKIVKEVVKKLLSDIGLEVSLKKK